MTNANGCKLRCSETPSADHTERHESAGNASWRSGVKHPMRYEKRGRDDIIYVRTAPRGVDPASTQVFDQGTGKFPLPLAGQPGRERGGNGLPKKPAPGRGQHRMKGMALTNVVSALPTSWVTGGERADVGTRVGAQPNEESHSILGETEWAGTSGLVSDGQTTTTSFIRLVLPAYPGMKWNRRNAKRYRIGFFFWGGDKLASSQAPPRPAAAGSPHLL
uniref:Zinc finger protein n=1 Tax=Populus euphratica TaxID=75702 RepID=Q6RUR5_POPEU|nr:zinc finger protein [Populus euphratica]